MSSDRLKKALLIVLGFPIVLPLLTLIGVIRLINEITTRTVKRGIIICPHCGAPGVVETEHPQVIR